MTDHRPMADEVELREGDTVYWDDRTGWEARITRIHPDGLLDVQYENGESDTRIERRMFSTRRSYRGRTAT